jgi:sulfonate transport system ATP-binding protein
MSASVLTPPAVQVGRPAGMRPLEVRFDRAGKTFRTGGVARSVLSDVSFTVAPGEVVAILGPSGCGKSTLLRIAAGLDTASSGAVLIGGTPVTGIDTRCAVAFQEPRLLPWRSLRDNVALGLPRGTGRRAGGDAVDRLLGLVGLAGHAGHRPR